MIGMAIGAALALLALGYVLYPLLAGTKPLDAGPPGLTCSKCGALARSAASFCAGCGWPLSQDRTKTGLGNGS